MTRCPQAAAGEPVMSLLRRPSLPVQWKDTCAALGGLGKAVGQASACSGGLSPATVLWVPVCYHAQQNKRGLLEGPGLANHPETSTGFRALAAAWPSHTCCRHLRNELAENIHLPVAYTRTGSPEPTPLSLHLSSTFRSKEEKTHQKLKLHSHAEVELWSHWHFRRPFESQTQLSSERRRWARFYQGLSERLLEEAARLLSYTAPCGAAQPTLM